MKFISSIVFLFVTSLVSSQRITEFEKILNVDKLPFSDREIRVYKKREISTGLELFRFYFDSHSRQYKAELHQTRTRRLKDESIKMEILKFDLNSIYNFEYLFFKMLSSDIKYIHNQESISYKMKPKATAYVDNGYVSFIEGKGASVLDGYSYYIQVKDEKSFNEIEYSNPERYQELYPLIDEYISVCEFLDIIKTSFGVFTDK